MENLKQEQENRDEESIEAPKATTKVFSKEELIERIYKGESLPQDPRFLSTEEGGVFKYFEPSDLTSIELSPANKKHYPAVMIEDTIVGLAELETDPEDENNLWIKFISVDPVFQGRGYASELVKEMFSFARENNYSLTLSYFSSGESKQKLLPVLEREAKETGVTLIRSEK